MAAGKMGSVTNRHSSMNPRLPVVFVHGFIGTPDVAGYEHPHAAPDMLGYARHQDMPDWSLEKCAGQHTLADSGRLMMQDDPAAFTAAIRRFLAG